MTSFQFIHADRQSIGFQGPVKLLVSPPHQNGIIMRSHMGEVFWNVNIEKTQTGEVEIVVVVIEKRQLDDGDQKIKSV